MKKAYNVFCSISHISTFNLLSSQQRFLFIAKKKLWFSKINSVLFAHILKLIFFLLAHSFGFIGLSYSNLCMDAHIGGKWYVVLKTPLILIGNLCTPGLQTGYCHA